MENNSRPVTEDEATKRARQKRIGAQLRKLYEDVASEPVPDDFLRLLEEADRKKSDSSE